MMKNHISFLFHKDYNKIHCKFKLKKYIARYQEEIES